jgi:hypothetical protein
MKAIKAVFKIAVIVVFFGGVGLGVVMLTDRLNRESNELSALKMEIRESNRQTVQQVAITVLMYSRQYLGGMNQVYQMRVSLLSAGRDNVLVSSDDSYEKLLGNVTEVIEAWIAGKLSEKSCSVSEEDLKKEARLAEIRAIGKAVADLDKITDDLFRAGPADFKRLQQEFRSKEADLRGLAEEVKKPKGTASS